MPEIFAFAGKNHDIILCNNILNFIRDQWAMNMNLYISRNQVGFPRNTIASMIRLLQARKWNILCCQ